MHKPVIICVDDEPTVLESLKIELKRLLGDTCLIETAEGGLEALELMAELQQDQYEIALVLADYIMPDIKGDELLKQVHSRSPHTLNIMISGQADLAAVGNAIRYGRLYRYIAKPWRSEDLQTNVLEAVQSYLQAKKLDVQNAKLRQTNEALQQSVLALRQAEVTLRQQAERERIIGLIAQQIRRSLNLADIIHHTAVEVRAFLQADRVLLYQFAPNYQARVVVVESVAESYPAMPKQHIHDLYVNADWLERYRQGDYQAIADVRQAALMPDHLEFLQRFQVAAKLMIPILVETDLWGLLVVHQCGGVREWQPAEINLIQQLATQVGIAIQQSQLYQQVQQFNDLLEQQVTERTTQLQQALTFEALLKRITDKVRDSLDETQILQTAVQELAIGLGVDGCDAALYDIDRRTATICYESIRANIVSAKDVSVSLDQRPDLYRQILQGQYVHSCLTELEADDCRELHKVAAILVCPLMDERGVLGDMWSFKPADSYFNELEIRLAQQVANQCAIALRQSRLYQLAQSQVLELERLSQVKDDFLSSVSHELRSPMANIKMAIQMLEISLTSLGVFDVAASPTNRYFQVLKDECQRETELIDDLLDLARLEAGIDALNLRTMDLADWLPQIAAPFIERASNQQQHFELVIPAALPMITTDWDYLKRSLTELMHNACKYTPSGGTIVVAVLSGTAEALQLCIKNSGVEIPVNERDRIFDKFYRIPHPNPWKYGGTGLGLALVQQQIKQLQGTIALMDEPGWTGFVLQIPNSLYPKNF